MAFFIYFAEYFIDYLTNLMLKKDSTTITYPKTTLSAAAFTSTDPDTNSRLVILPQLLAIQNNAQITQHLIGPGGSYGSGYKNDVLGGVIGHTIVSSDHDSPINNKDFFVSDNLLVNLTQVDASTQSSIIQASHQYIVDKLMHTDDIVLGLQYDSTVQRGMPTISAGTQNNGAGGPRIPIPIIVKSPLYLNSINGVTVGLTVIDYNLALNVPTVENPNPSFTVHKMLPININGNVYHVQLFA